MKKNDGYILLYVMVVVMTLCILSGAICTSAVRNLKVQQHSVDHMKFVYEAEGIGERFVAELQKAIRLEKDGTTKKLYSVRKSEPGADQQYHAAVESIFTGALDTAKTHALADAALEGDRIEIVMNQIGEYDSERQKIDAVLELQTISGDSSLDSKIKVTMKVQMEEVAATQSGEPAKYTYGVKAVSFEYLSYVIGAVDTASETPEAEGGNAE